VVTCSTSNACLNALLVHTQSTILASFAHTTVLLASEVPILVLLVLLERSSSMEFVTTSVLSS